MNYLTISEICKETDVSNSSCRRYLSEFDGFFSVKGGGRVKKYEEQAVNVIMRIKHLYDEGKDKDEIYNVLVNEFPLVIDGEEEQSNNESVPSLATSDDIAEIKGSLNEQKEFNAELLKRLDQQQQYIDKRLEERDQLLMESINKSLETQKQIASTREEEQKRSFWARLFNRNDNQ